MPPCKVITFCTYVYPTHREAKHTSRHRTGAGRTSENPLKAKFGELHFHALGRIESESDQGIEPRPGADCPPVYRGEVHALNASHAVAVSCPAPPPRQAHRLLKTTLPRRPGRHSGRYSRPEVAARPRVRDVPGPDGPLASRRSTGSSRPAKFVRRRLNGLLISALPVNARVPRKTAPEAKRASLDIYREDDPPGPSRRPRGAAPAGALRPRPCPHGFRGARPRAAPGLLGFSIFVGAIVVMVPVPVSVAVLPPSPLRTGSGGLSRRDEIPLLFKVA